MYFMIKALPFVLYKMGKEKEDYGLSISERGSTTKNRLLKLSQNVTVL